MTDYELPPRLHGESGRDLAALRDYLVRLVGALPEQAGGEGQTAAVRTLPGTQTPNSESRTPNSALSASALRALIVKSADRQAADKAELEQRIEAIDGTYFYIRYSPVENPTAAQMTAAPEEDTAYMGVCSTNRDMAPTDPADYVWSRILGEDALTLQIVSSNGSIFKNGRIGTVLAARVWLGDEDVTAAFDENDFRWTRSSEDAAQDAAWNAEHFGGAKRITVTGADVSARATFFCTLT